MANKVSLAEAIIALFVSFLSLILFYVTKHRYKSSHLPPGPTPWPIVGCIPQMLLQKPVFRWVHRFMEEKGVEIACFRFGNVHVFPVICPKIAREFLKKHDAAFASRPLTMATYSLSDGYRTSVLSPYGETSKRMRRLLASEMLSSARLRLFKDKRDEESDNLLKYLFCQSKTVCVVNMRVAFRSCAGNITRRLMFNKRYFGLGRQDGGPTFREQEYLDAIFLALKHIYGFCISDYLPSLAGFDLDGHQKTIKDCQRTILKYHLPIIDERIEQWRNADSTAMEVQDWLDIMITLKKSDGSPLLTREDIIAESTELALAAIDNPPTAAEWTIAEMIEQPHLMTRAVEELDRVVGKERLVHEEDLPKLKYVRACARESLRLHPVNPFNVPHVSMHDTVVAGYHIPKGSHVLLSRMGLGRNPRVWDHPLEFIPERHLPDDYDALQDNCGNVTLAEPELRFISFSTGRRGCIGVELGTTVTLMLIARVLQAFSCTNISQNNLQESEDELFPKQPLMASVHPRLPIHLYPK